MTTSVGASEPEVDALTAELDKGPANPGKLLLEIARRQAEVGDLRAAARALGRLVAADSSFRNWSAAARLLRQIPQLAGLGLAPLRVALLGTATLDQLGEVLPVASLPFGLDVTMYVAGYGQYESEILDPGSALYDFDPNVVILAPDESVVRFPALADDAEAALTSELQRWTSVWKTLEQRTQASVAQFNLVPPLARPLGGLEATLPGSRRQRFSELNRQLAQAAGPRIHIVDAMSVAMEIGLRNWRDDRYWFHAKQPVALGAIPPLAREIAATLGAIANRGRKVLVTDLDNTLWGGVVGEDGVGHLQLGGSAVGEAHLALQSYLLDLKARGVLLAVCSKNDDTDARAPFAERDDMLLSLDDFVAFVANWRTKPANLRQLALDLNLGLDSFAFIDDNPAEREIVRQQLPEVDIIELPPDPSGYRNALADYRGFETLRLTQEDSVRTEQYRARAAAADLEASSHTLEEFLESLDMVADIRPFDDETIQRVTQLVGKTNQWNMTTRRHSIETLRAFADDPGTLAFSLRLTDRFADHGIVGVAIATTIDDVLEIDTLLMSCRVIGRTVERTMIGEVVERATQLGLGEIRGRYLRTEKNSSVALAYADLGFVLVEEYEDGTLWRRAPLEEAGTVSNPFITRRADR